MLIRTDAGVKLAHAQFERMCFEVDEIDRHQRSAWSVLIKGVMHTLAASDHHVDELSFAASSIVPWAGGPKGHVLVVTPVGVSGRRIVSE